jgi:hypothetical protein
MVGNWELDFPIARHTTGIVHARDLVASRSRCPSVLQSTLRDTFFIELLGQKRGAKSESKTYV